ncbi:hypothetical protein [Bacillus cereus]|jgi:hypothetical protein|uniref:hypothetical protein n=1 Tax=Bacillus cereus TaxID=1396 RepID=UPI0015D4B577|nr:hypothetical protein [Bacillus cereus]
MGIAIFNSNAKALKHLQGFFAHPRKRGIRQKTPINKQPTKQKGRRFILGVCVHAHQLKNLLYPMPIKLRF